MVFAEVWQELCPANSIFTWDSVLSPNSHSWKKQRLLLPLAGEELRWGVEKPPSRAVTVTLALLLLSHSDTHAGSVNPQLQGASGPLQFWKVPCVKLGSALHIVSSPFRCSSVQILLGCAAHPTRAEAWAYPLYGLSLTSWVLEFGASSCTNTTVSFYHKLSLVPSHLNGSTTVNVWLFISLFLKNKLHHLAEYKWEVYISSFIA